MNKVVLPETVHVILTIDNDPYGDAYGVVNRFDRYRVEIPSIWLKFEGQEKYHSWSWNKKYIKKIENTLGSYMKGDITVVEWNIIQDVAYLMKSSNNLGFDVMNYYTQLKPEDIKYFNSVGIN